MRLPERGRVPRDRTRRPRGSAPSRPAGRRDGRPARCDRRARRRGPPRRPARPACPPTRATAPAARGGPGTRCPSCSSSGPSRYLPVSGSCSTSSCRSSVRSSPCTVVFASPSRSASSLTPSRGEPGRERLEDPRRAVDRLDRAGLDGRSSPIRRSRPPPQRARAPNNKAVEAAPDLGARRFAGPRYEARPFRACIGVVAAAPASAAAPRGVAAPRAAPPDRASRSARSAGVHASTIVLSPSSAAPS